MYTKLCQKNLNEKAVWDLGVSGSIAMVLKELECLEWTEFN
jgi:hypothetical protein